MNEPVQPDLFSRPDGGGHQSAATDTAWLEGLLDTLKEWATAAEILQSIGKPVTDDNKRWLRDVASRCQYVLSGPGSPGYRHIKHCTIEEVDHYRNAMITQGKEMIRRGIKISRSAHKIFG